MQPIKAILKQYAGSGKALLFSVPANKQVKLYRAKVVNGSGGASDLALVRKLLGLYTTVSPLVALDTPDAGDAVPIIDMPETTIFAGANNDGFLVQSDLPFGLVGLTISAEQAGGTYTYQYFNGTAFATLATIAVPADYNAKADRLIAFIPPHDWAPGTTEAVGGEAAKYTILVRSTVAPGGAVKVSAMWVGDILAFDEAVADKGSMEFSLPEGEHFLMEGGEGLMPYFGTSNAGNYAYALYRIED